MTSPPEPGSFADEAARLLAVVQDKISMSTRAARGAGDDVWERATATDGTDADLGAPECAFCPVCRAMRALRTVHPDAVEHLAEAASAFVAAVQDLRRDADPGEHQPADVRRETRDDQSDDEAAAAAEGEDPTWR